MVRSLWPAEAKHLFFYQRQLNPRCCQHHIILKVPISLRVALRKVMSLNSWWLNGFCTGKSTPRCAVYAGVWCNCFAIRLGRGEKEITRRYSTSWEQAGLRDPAWVVLMLIPLETPWTCLLLQDAAWSCQDNRVPLPQPGHFTGMALISIGTVYKSESMPTLTLCSSREHHASSSGGHHERSTYLSSCYSIPCQQTV